MNLANYLARSAMFWPDAEALVAGDRRWTYEQLDTETTALAAALAERDVVPGTAVATFAANRGELVVVEMALARAGAVRVPLSVRLADAEVQHVLADAGIPYVFVDAANAERMEGIVAAAGLSCRIIRFDAPPGAAADPALCYPDLVARGSVLAPDYAVPDLPLDHPAVLNFTSGSSGSLKAAVQTVGNRQANVRKMAMNPQSTLAHGSVYLVAGPITHASGMGILGCFFRGATVVVLPVFDPELFLDTVERERVTQAFLVPVMLNRILASPSLPRRDLGHVRALTLGGAPVTPARLREAVAVLGPIVNQGYGQGETTSAITFLTAEDVRRGVEEDPELLLSCGRPLFDTEVRIVSDDGTFLPPGEIGEIVARGADCVSEYFHDPEATVETFRDGWVHTGDLGYIRPDGYVFIVDRKKDMIISGGFNVYCTEVEAALYEHPDVYEAVVVGIPSPEWGEAVKAFVTPQANARPTQEDLQAFCSERLARYKVPRLIEFVGEIPRNRNGKLDRRALRGREWAGSVRQVG
jgi:acyl-CoA synthetase (AMP-forming)/AMP-acid ligase II